MNINRTKCRSYPAYWGSNNILEFFLKKHFRSTAAKIYVDFIVFIIAFLINASYSHASDIVAENLPIKYLSDMKAVFYKLKNSNKSSIYIVNPSLAFRVRVGAGLLPSVSCHYDIDNNKKLLNEISNILASNIISVDSPIKRPLDIRLEIEFIDKNRHLYSFYMENAQGSDIVAGQFEYYSILLKSNATEKIRYILKESNLIPINKDLSYC